MNCKRCLEHIPLIPGNEADEHTIREVLAHVETCSSCREELEKYEFLSSTLSSMSDMDDIDFNWERFTTRTAEKVLENRRKNKERASRFLNLRNAAAAVLGAAAVLLFTVGIGTGFESASEPLTPETKGVSAEGVLKPVSPEEAGLLLAGKPVEARKPDVTALVETEPLVRIRTKVWLGLTVEVQGRGAVRVKGVVLGGPAEKGGVRSGDMVVSCCGKPSGDIRSLKEAIAQIEPGDTVTLTVLRNGVRKDISFKAEKLPHHL